MCRPPWPAEQDSGSRCGSLREFDCASSLHLLIASLVNRAKARRKYCESFPRLGRAAINNSLMQSVNDVATSAKRGQALPHGALRKADRPFGDVSQGQLEWLRYWTVPGNFERTEEIRNVAAGVGDDACRQALALLARRNDQMAERLENSERENGIGVTAGEHRS